MTKIEQDIENFINNSFPPTEDWEVTKRARQAHLRQIVINALEPVKSMREAQKNWFKTKDKKYLSEAFRLEAEVDKMLKELLDA